MKKQRIIIFITAAMVSLLFLSCEGVAALFHGPKPEFIITFDSNGATNGTVPDAQSVGIRSSINLPDAGSMAKTGYTFGGWNTNASGTGTNYAGKVFYKPVADITLYARWYYIEMVKIQPGTFWMGSPPDEPGRFDNETRHKVTLTKSFYMGKYQVTQAEYEAVMGTNPSHFKTPVVPETSAAKRPVERVSWYDAIVFCNKLSISEGLSPAYRIQSSTNPADWGTVPPNNNVTWNNMQIVKGSTGYRLPTEAQWEYACRAGTTTTYSTGDTISDNTGWYSDNSGDFGTREVGLKLPNAWGLYDMHGNVWEWCWDRYGSYSSGAQTDPLGAASGSGRIMRGGCWGNHAGTMRSAYRASYDPFYMGTGDGFRLVRP